MKIFCDEEDNLDVIKTAFSLLKNGSIFMHNVDVCMKMRPQAGGKWHNFIRLNTGVSGRLDDDAYVDYRYDALLVLP